MLQHHTIVLRAISLELAHKTCFINFSARIQHGRRIVIIGRNGSGKSTLLQIIQGIIKPSQGSVTIPTDVTFGYVPQIIQEHDALSGGQRFNKELTSALSPDPNVLCLDEPTNHLDLANRRSFLRMIKSYTGTLIMVTHDTELLKTKLDEIWTIDNEKITIFLGDYHAYLLEKEIARKAHEEELEALKKEQKKMRVSLQAEHKRAASSKRANIHENDRLLRGTMRENADTTAGKKQKHINAVGQQINDKLAALAQPEVIKAKFHLSHADGAKNKAIIAISDGSCGYQTPVLTNITLHVSPTSRIAILGPNGSGKSTLIKAIRADQSISKTGSWHIPKPTDIGYLDQHYQTLDPDTNAIETIEAAAPMWGLPEIRKHLNAFLFRKNEEVSAKIKTLSGGERARLCLAQIAAQNPRLVILDEMTNNIDLEAREHIIQVLAAYPGAVLVISHDQDFLQRIGITDLYEIKDNTLRPVTT